MKGDIIIMKMKKLMAALVVITLLAMSVVCSADATYTTTTSYRVSDGKVQVTTTVEGLTAGSMATYVLYGYPDGYTDKTDKTINYATDDVIDYVGEDDFTETNILYIDQINSVSSEAKTFGSGVWLDPKKVIGSKVIVGTNDSTITTIENKSTELLDQGIACFKLELDTTNGANLADAKINKIDVSFAFPEEETETYTLSSDQSFVYIPAGVDYTLTFDVIDNSVMGAVSIDSKDVSSQIVMNKYKGTSAENDRDKTKTLVLGVGETAGSATKYISIDSNPIFGTDENGYNTITFVVNNKTGYATTGIDIIAYDKNGVKVNEVLNLENKLKTSQTYAIRLVDELNNTFIDTTKYDYEAVPYYYDETDTKVSLTNLASSKTYYYTVNRKPFVEKTETSAEN